VTPRILAALLAFLLVGDSAIETDPFLAALAGKSGKDAVAAPTFDPELEALSWSLRPRREIVDALASRLLRGEADGWYGESTEAPGPEAPRGRDPKAPDPAKVEVADRLASRVPVDAAVVFFGSLKEAWDAVDGLAKFLPEALPGLCGDPLGGKRDALRRAVDMLLLPTIWRSNPEVRTGTRQVALVVSDPDLRWAPDVALLCEVDDASLVLAHRKATFSWEERGKRRIRIDGLDATADDGSIRSYFALEGGVAIWSTTRSLRDRVLAAASGMSPSLLADGGEEYAFARKMFPHAEGGALLVRPQAMLRRLNAGVVRCARASTLRCEAARLLLDADCIAGKSGDDGGKPRWICPAGGALRGKSGEAGSSCSVHGTAAFPVPLGDLPAGRLSDLEWYRKLFFEDSVRRGEIPIALRWRGRPVEIAMMAKGVRLVNMMRVPFRQWTNMHGEILVGGKPGPWRGFAARSRRLEGRAGILESLTGLEVIDPSTQARTEEPDLDGWFRVVDDR
jgi:hypothetical protein